MFQSSKQREDAGETHICSACKLQKNCSFKPDDEKWRYVLIYCQKHKEE